MRWRGQREEEDDGYDTETREILKKRAQIQKKIKEEKDKMMKETFIPPPMEILRKKFIVREPVRTGFNQGLIPIKIKHNVEN